MPRLLSRFTVLLLALGLAACNPMENLEEATDQIDRFQTHFSFGEIDEMYKMVGREFRDTTSRDDFDEMVALISNRLGTVESTQRQSFNVNTTPMGTATVIVMQTDFEQGQGVETYTFRGNGQDMALIGWHVNSERLLITAQELERLKQPAS